MYREFFMGIEINKMFTVCFSGTGRDYKYSDLTGIDVDWFECYVLDHPYPENMVLPLYEFKNYMDNSTDDVVCLVIETPDNVIEWIEEMLNSWLDKVEKDEDKSEKWSEL